jgi:hypothetical protein
LETLHHHDILTEALTRFAREYAGHERQDILRELRKQSGLTVTSRALGSDGVELTQANVLPPVVPEPEAEKTDEGPPSPPVVGP